MVAGAFRDAAKLLAATLLISTSTTVQQRDKIVTIAVEPA